LEGRQGRRREAVDRSDFGVVGGLFKVVPQLIEDLKKRKAALLSIRLAANNAKGAKWDGF
jgi:hypothetical protein